MTASVSREQILSFRRKILRFYARHGRDLPWRRTTDPYRITVSEIMLQQTQVERVIPKYLEWIDRWPSWRSLAKATTVELLRAWSGLGYNRRAIYLGKLAQAVVSRHGGKLPDSPEELRELPGIGPYTSKAILIFAFNRPLATIDTNIRRVLLHEFNWKVSTPAQEIERLAAQLVPPQRARDWHNALMDYSRLVLPRRLAAIPPTSRPSKFEGSLRQIRGEIVRQLLNRKTVAVETIVEVTGRDRDDVNRAIQGMVKEGLVRWRRTRLSLVD